MKGVIYILMSLLLLACSSKEEAPAPKLYTITDLGLLSTSEYTMGKTLILNDDGQWYKFGERKILISVQAKAKAGIDLAKVNEDAVKVDGKKVSIELPDPEIISFVMNPDEIQTQHQDVSGFRASFSQEEKMKILQMGEESIKKELLQSNIIVDARRNAQLFLEDFYKDLGYDEVVIYFPKDEGGKRK